ncbi:LytTR family DNA-binding domain-containing protein [Albidovulum aquaemixtae]|uniref:LytTR family DNA-binding domain-containing protein n=1 Tax=Albidovulum aquaemixtae TaxID=1542388 RepID=UPI001FE5CFFD|nr:LytTR family DNA-binding domain-containing protein [Defluviimonas aquaemixtae]
MIAILVTAALMIWQAGDAVRTGAEFRDQAVFWGASVTVGWLQMILIARGVRSSFGTDRYPGWALLLAQAFIGAAPLTFEVRWLVETIVAPEAGLPAPWVTYLNISVINVVFSLIQYGLIERWPLFRPEMGDAEGGAIVDSVGARRGDMPPTVGMLRRPPEGLSGVIRYLQMEDHYMRVHTDEGSGLVLHRMSDAVEDLADTDGRQVHKSWWVSRTAVEAVRLRGRRRILVATDGAEIPVGRSFERKLRAAGWF